MIKKNEDYQKHNGLVYKYDLVKELVTFTGILDRGFEQPLIKLSDDGHLTQSAGYAWDGCSGLAKDTEGGLIFGSNMHGGCCHDGVYQALREGWLISDRLLFDTYYKKFKELRKLADVMLFNQLKKDGVWYPRRKTYYYAVQSFGEKYALPEKLK